MNDVEQLNKEMDEELKNSPALRMAFVQIRSLETALDAALKQRAEDWEQIQQLQQQTPTKTCDQCKKTVSASEFNVIYEESGGGVCNWCYMYQYLPYTKEFSRASDKE